jgi:hypothetical protein
MLHLYGSVHAPTRRDMAPIPEGNPAHTIPFFRAWDRAYWGAILHAYRTGRAREAWDQFVTETDRIEA